MTWQNVECMYYFQNYSGSDRPLVANLDRLDFEVERNKRENETLGKGLSDIQKRIVDAYLQILDEIVEYTKSFRVLTVLDINQGPNFCSLTRNREYSSSANGNARTSKAMWSFPTRISSSCFPTMFFFGQFVSSSLEKR
jgi:hypothetical protein